MIIPSKELRQLQAKEKELEKKMDEIIRNDGSISDWQKLRDQLNIISNHKIPAEMNRCSVRKPTDDGVHVYSIPRYV